jgi:hypothetical protein
MSGMTSMRSSAAPVLRLVEPAVSVASSATGAGRSLGDLVRRRVSGDHEIDPWGLDADLVSALAPLAAVRYDVLVDHAHRVPAEGSALLVANRRFGVSEAIVLVRGLRQATGRHVRVVGAPTFDPLGPLAHRLGAVVARPDEVAGLLRAGEAVAVFLDRDPHPRTRAGRIPTELVAPAFALGAPVVPVGLLGRELGRFWRVRVGAAVRHPDGRGPLAVAELAERARASVQATLDEADPPRGWI